MGSWRLSHRHSLQNSYRQDIKEKRARYIERNCELNQEIPFDHPQIKCRLKRIFNSSFYGSSLWDLTIHPKSHAKSPQFHKLGVGGLEKKFVGLTTRLPEAIPSGYPQIP